MNGDVLSLKHLTCDSMYGYRASFLDFYIPSVPTHDTKSM